MTNLPPLAPLASFRAAARHGSFTKAAQELHVTHGAVSRAVKQLEGFFGFELFERRNRGIYLTDRGRAFAAQVETLFAGLERTCEELKTTSPAPRLSVSCEPTLAMRWLMPRLDDFHRAAPDAEVLLSTAGGLIDLSEQGVDLAIRRSDFAWSGRYHSESLGREPIGPVCSPAYWAAHEHTPKRLLHTRTRPSAWTDWKGLSGQTPDADAEQYFDHFYFSLQAATAGLGLAIGPLPMVRDALAQNLLVAPYGFTTTPTDYVVITRRPPAPDSPAQAFITWLTQTLDLPRS
ncbi:LysR substrate-binding domain-containing protein [Pseudodesulfovibrio methanolicus]|uniref:LysR substrate-binding domain-containing protein n=1 Tax=Pseudodesulfovibrio methanolicus TaxID=3126690 RepID=A0ABZ2J2Y4_9BACT